MEKTKKRMIVEARYRALMTMFDKRGAVLEALASVFGDRLQHWKVDTASVTYTDLEQNELLRINIGHQRSSIVLENYQDENQAIKDAISTFVAIQKLFANELKTTGRLGVRFIDVLSSESISSFETAHKIVKHGFLNNSIPLTVPATDVRATMNFERGSLNVGPVRAEEHWCREVFSSIDTNMPKFGIGLDVDSFIESTSWSTEAEITKSIRGVAAMTGSVQGEVVKYLAELASGKTS